VPTPFHNFRFARDPGIIRQAIGGTTSSTELAQPKPVRNHSAFRSQIQFPLAKLLTSSRIRALDQPQNRHLQTKRGEHPAIPEIGRWVLCMNLNFDRGAEISLNLRCVLSYSFIAGTGMCLHALNTADPGGNLSKFGTGLTVHPLPSQGLEVLVN
jgi:hypothetical protein